jgi:hypothetical protein
LIACRFICSHYYCPLQAPLLIGTDVTNMTAATLATLTNKEVIAVNQVRDYYSPIAAAIFRHYHS